MLLELQIPTPSGAVLKRVASLIESAVENRERYSVAVRKTRNIIDELADVNAASALYGERRARCIVQESKSLETLGAWHYASTGGALQYLARTWAGRLQDVVKPNGCL